MSEAETEPVDELEEHQPVGWETEAEVRTPTEDDIEGVRRSLRRGQRLYDRAQRKPINSHGREKDLFIAAEILRRAQRVAAECGVPPGDFPKWAWELTYGEQPPTSTEAQSLAAAQEAAIARGPDLRLASPLVASGDHRPTRPRPQKQTRRSGGKRSPAAAGRRRASGRGK